MFMLRLSEGRAGDPKTPSNKAKISVTASFGKVGTLNVLSLQMVRVNG